MLTRPDPTSSLRDRLRGSWRILRKEVAAFGVVGIVGFIVDAGIYNLLFHHGQVFARTISTTLAVAITYFGNRHWSFSHRARTGLGRETSFFVAINVITLAVSLAITAVFSYPLHYKNDRLVMNLVFVGTTAIGTIFRFWAYKRFVFLHPDKVHSPDVDLDEELAEN